MIRKHILSFIVICTLMSNITAYAEEETDPVPRFTEETQIESNSFLDPTTDTEETFTDTSLTDNKNNSGSEISNAPWTKVQYLEGVNLQTGELIDKSKCGTIKFRMEIPFVLTDDFVYLECIKLDDMSTWGIMARSYTSYTANAELPEGEYLLDFCRLANDAYGDYRIEPVTFSVIKGATQIQTVPLISIYPTEEELDETASNIAELESEYITEEETNSIVLNNVHNDNIPKPTIQNTAQKTEMPIWVKTIAIISISLIVCAVIIYFVLKVKNSK